LSNSPGQGKYCGWWTATRINGYSCLPLSRFRQRA
jgi:hypothetical protein